MKTFITQQLHEELSKKDMDSAIKTFLNSTEFNAKIEKIVRQRIKNEKALEDRVVKICQNVTVQLYKALWTKRNFWKTQLKNVPN